MTAFAIIVYCVSAVLLALEAGRQIRQLQLRGKAQTSGRNSAR